MQKKYQVFVSSTFRDLAEERQDAIKSVLDLGHIPAGMEMFPAADTSQLDYIKKVIDECDYYLLIIGGRYGSTDINGVSYTEREYDYAYGTGKIVLAFVNEDFASIPVGKTDNDPNLTDRLKNFREKVMNGRLVRQWSNRTQLETLVLKGLIHAFGSQPAVGWIRGDAVASEDLLNQINILRLENERLKVGEKNNGEKQPAVIADLAALDSFVTLEAEYYDFTYSQNIRKEFSIKWAEAFVATGPIMIDVASHDAIRVALNQFLKSRFSLESSYNVDIQHVYLVQNQLQALGFISLVRASASSKKSGGFVLTDLGSKELMSLLAVKK